MRPVWFEFPEAEATYGVEDQFMLGPVLLAAPVLEEGAAKRQVLLPQQAIWFDAATGAHLLWACVPRARIWFETAVGTHLACRWQLLGGTGLTMPFKGTAVVTAYLCHAQYHRTCYAGAPVATDGKPQEVAVTMESVPAYLRGGHIMARKERARRSTAAMAADPITLVGSVSAAAAGLVSHMSARHI